MRRLLYVPIVHDESDMGSAGAALARQSATLSGERRWTLLKETLESFWENVSSYLLSLDLHRLKLYQDGLAADGEMARRIVEEAAERGSRNYRLVLEMLRRGAEIRKTEDLALLMQEHEIMQKSVQQSLAGGTLRETERGRLERSRLTEKRDKFIAEAIGATLKDGEVGVLFIGAYHDVASWLATDISVDKVKEPEKLQTYFAEIFSGHDDDKLNELAQYLTSPISTI